MIQELKKFISIQTIAHNDNGNQMGIQYISNLLIESGFQVSLEGNSPTNQPVLVGQFANTQSDQKVVLYAHYDVEKINRAENWDSPPFEIHEKEGRYFCRGIADNKGILLCRLLAIREMYLKGETLPNILWIIQGEEEVAGPTPFTVIPKLLEIFGSKLYVEETGIYKDNIPVIFHLPETETVPDFLQDMNQAIYDGEAILQNRCLNKFTKCPFLTNIPKGGYYVGFGPNDKFCRIHRDNESLSISNLKDHSQVFKKFIRWVVQAEI